MQASGVPASVFTVPSAFSTLSRSTSTKRSACSRVSQISPELKRGALSEFAASDAFAVASSASPARIDPHSLRSLQAGSPNLVMTQCP
jgi:hypothetical protein